MLEFRMSIEDGNSYLTETREMTGAYSAMDSRYFLLGDSLEAIKSHPIERLQGPASDYLSTGIAFLANRVNDPLIEEVGTTAYKAMNRQLARIGFTNSIAGAFMQLNFPREQVLEAIKVPNEPYFVVMGNEKQKFGLVFISPDFIYKARTHPIEALASTAWIASQIRDLANGRIPGDLRVNDRSEAIEAQFLHLAFKENPDAAIGPLYKEKMEKYPHGLESLKLE